MSSKGLFLLDSVFCQTGDSVARGVTPCCFHICRLMSTMFKDASLLIFLAWASCVIYHILRGQLHFHKQFVNNLHSVNVAREQHLPAVMPPFISELLYPHSLCQIKVMLWMIHLAYSHLPYNKISDTGKFAVAFAKICDSNHQQEILREVTGVWPNYCCRVAIVQTVTDNSVL